MAGNDARTIDARKCEKQKETKGSPLKIEVEVF